MQKVGGRVLPLPEFIPYGYRLLDKWKAKLGRDTKHAAWDSMQGKRLIWMHAMQISQQRDATFERVNTLEKWREFMKERSKDTAFLDELSTAMQREFEQVRLYEKYAAMRYRIRMLRKKIAEKRADDKDVNVDEELASIEKLKADVDALNYVDTHGLVSGWSSPLGLVRSFVDVYGVDTELFAGPHNAVLLNWCCTHPEEWRHVSAGKTMEQYMRETTGPVVGIANPPWFSNPTWTAFTDAMQYRQEQNLPTTVIVTCDYSKRMWTSDSENYKQESGWSWDRLTKGFYTAEIIKPGMVPYTIPPWFSTGQNVTVTKRPTFFHLITNQHLDKPDYWTEKAAALDGQSDSWLDMDATNDLRKQLQKETPDKVNMGTTIRYGKGGTGRPLVRAARQTS
eukprot:TRINITY_DN34588_c0_g1_i1.p1 TRINITY_DN34588_c0_g1~~TRINITY_DN34588_c0_g1_i1.p1  ORF type:complete len:395 (+),score=21.49 TRINITY_DN34588_c0_g1_i1:45-1229(+)